MNRRSFIKRFGMGVLAASMVRDALLSPIQNQAQFIIRDLSSQVYYYTKHGVGFKISKQLIEDDLYESQWSGFKSRTTKTAG